MWYHEFVYDIPRRQFLGRFEELYKDERTRRLDAWHQDALGDRDDVRLAQSVLDDVKASDRVRTVLDIGCGKGTLADHLFSDCESYVGIDVSKTAVEIASMRYPAMRFVEADIQDGADLSRVLKRTHINELDLFFSIQTLSYISNWQDVIRRASEVSRTVLILLYLPPNPIGFVKSFDELIDEVAHVCGSVSCSFTPSGTHIAVLGRRRDRFNDGVSTQRHDARVSAFSLTS